MRGGAFVEVVQDEEMTDVLSLLRELSPIAEVLSFATYLWVWSLYWVLYRWLVDNLMGHE